jgi:hypothetical protein
MYEDPDKRQYSPETLQTELQRRKTLITGAVGPEVTEIMNGVRTLTTGASLDVPSTTKGPDGQPATYATITEVQDHVYTITTFYVQLDNHIRGPCHGVGEIPLGMGFAALGGNSAPPATGFTKKPAKRVF